MNEEVKNIIKEYRSADFESMSKGEALEILAEMAAKMAEHIENNL